MQPNPLYVPYAVQYPQRHLKKLFVGQIPKTFTEEDVKQIFSDTCQVYTAHIIKDKVTMEHRGTLFIHFFETRMCVYICRSFCSRVS